MPSPLTVTVSSRASWNDVDHVLLTALRNPGLPGDLAATSNLPQDLVASQLDVYVRDGLATRTGLGGLHYQLTLTGWKQLFSFAETSANPGHQAAA